MKKGLFLVMVLVLLAAFAVPAFAANGLNARESSRELGQGALRAHIGELLKLDAGALRELRKEGMSMLAVAESTGYNADEFVNDVVQFRRDQLAQLVAAGEITDLQSQHCEEMMTERIRANLERAPEPKRIMQEKLQVRQNRGAK